MTITQARKILGKDAENISDEVILSDIETSEMFESIFFEVMMSKKGLKPKTTGLDDPNMP